MVKPDLERICAALRPSGFARVQAFNEVAVARPAERADLFERIELVLVGRRREALSVAAAVSVVQHPDLTLEGLGHGAPLEELYPQPETGRVSFEDGAEQAAWVERLAQLAPKKVRELARADGEALLERTAHARRLAARAFDRIVRPALRAGSYPEELEARLTPEELDAVEGVMGLPPMRVVPLWEGHGRAAASALVLLRDPDVLSPARGAAGMNVPPAAWWKLRLLLDRILRATAPGASRT